MATPVIKTDTDMELSVPISTETGLTDLQNVTLTAKLEPQGKPDQAIPLTLDIPDPLGLDVIISLTRAETAALNPGKHVFDIQILNNNTNKVRNTETGEITIQRSIT